MHENICGSRVLFVSKNSSIYIKITHARSMYTCKKTPQYCVSRDLYIYIDVCRSRDLRVYQWEKKYLHVARPIYIKNTHLYTSKIHTQDLNMHIHEYTTSQQVFPICIKRNLHRFWIYGHTKETYIYSKRYPQTRFYLRVRKRLRVARPTYVKRDLHIWKETYIFEKRPTYLKRDLHIW